MSVPALSTFYPLTEERISEIWQEIDIYTQLAQRAKSSRYILREMPIAAHHLKLDTLKCKIHQDVFLKVNMMQGVGTEYVPQWNHYTSAVEQRALDSEQADRAFDALQFRRHCRREFQHEVEHRQAELQALGIFGNWKRSSKNMATRDEARIISTFSKLLELGYLHKDRKLGYWCPKCNAALNEDEVETRPAESHSGYVKFPVSVGLEEFGEDVYFLVWLQDLWKLAGTAAIGLEEAGQYVIVELAGEVLILTEEDLSLRLPAELRKGISALETRGTDVLTDCSCAHPLLGTDLPVVALPDLSQLGEVPEKQMGVRHLAPGHHLRDYQVAQALQLPIVSVVDDAGCLAENSEQFCGLEVSEAGKFIAFELEKRGYLVYAGHEVVSQPHCWTCDVPALFRPVQQWGFSLESNHLRKRVLYSADYWVGFSPLYKDWIQQAVQSLSNPCVSCRRGWGIPIPIFLCEKCGHQLSEPPIIKTLRDLISRRGSDVWFKLSAEDLLPQNTQCPECGAREFRKGATLIDGRFAVLLNAVNNSEVKRKSSWPSHVYFFSSDQFHKWFAQFILTSIAIHDAAPSHVELMEVAPPVQSVKVSESWIDKYPKDLLRLLGIHPDFDHPSVDALIQQCQMEYSTVQTLCTAILSCLETFDPGECTLSLETLLPLDALALSITNRVLQSVDVAYQQRQFHKAWCILRDFCQSDLQQFYMPVLQYRFNLAAETREKRSGQTALWEILHVLIQRFAPITPFLAEQIHVYLHRRNAASLPSGCIQHEEQSEFSSVFLKDWISQINIPHITDADNRWKELSGKQANEFS